MVVGADAVRVAAEEAAGGEAAARGRRLVPTGGRKWVAAPGEEELWLPEEAGHDDGLTWAACGDSETVLYLGVSGSGLGVSVEATVGMSREASGYHEPT